MRSVGGSVDGSVIRVAFVAPRLALGTRASLYGTPTLDEPSFDHVLGRWRILAPRLRCPSWRWTTFSGTPSRTSSSVTSIYLQGIDPDQIIQTVHAADRR